MAQHLRQKLGHLEPQPKYTEHLTYKGAIEKYINKKEQYETRRFEELEANSISFTVFEITTEIKECGFNKSFYLDT